MNKSERRKLRQRCVDREKMGYLAGVDCKDILALLDRIEKLEGALKMAREEIKSGIEGRFYAMGKEYLAKQYVEESSALKHIDLALAEDDKLANPGGAE